MGKYGTNSKDHGLKLLKYKENYLWPLQKMHLRNIRVLAPTILSYINVKVHRTIKLTVWQAKYSQAQYLST